MAWWASHTNKFAFIIVLLLLLLLFVFVVVVFVVVVVVFVFVFELCYWFVFGALRGAASTGGLTHRLA